MVFLLFLVMEKWFSSLNRMLSGIFWRQKIFLNFLFFFKWFTVEKDGFSVGFFLPLALRMILLIWVSSKVRNFLRKCLRSTASPLCLKNELWQSRFLLNKHKTIFNRELNEKPIFDLKVRSNYTWA